MGAAAFVMAEWLRIPYLEIAKNYTPLTSCFYAIIGAVGMFLAVSADQGARRRPIVPGLEPASKVR